ncbi:MAG: hypothetical protein E5Y34_11065 [Mesorhizobium sp.]|uniref:hypothetical protein n=1 Tax=Mesorhizobium sp. TaxID=1871066 RepID=UPI001216EC7A|nr:hypothetical protein [Mesorhizobium sp.]TIN00988.1 MAG: hypothetical protein E5Y34_11065 [Mesorhizobium sp.]
MDAAPELYYRYYDYREGTGYTDVCGEYVPTGSRLRIRIETFPVIKHTPKGVWIRDIGGDSKFLLHTAIKRYADPTVEKALHSFTARKKRQQSIYEARAAQAAEAIILAERDVKKSSVFGGYII